MSTLEYANRAKSIKNKVRAVRQEWWWCGGWCGLGGRGSYSIIS